MERPQISDRDARDPTLLRLQLQRSVDRDWELLGRVDELEFNLRGVGATSGLTDDERALLRALSIGSTETPVAAQTSVVPSASSLPPVQSATPGELVYLTTDSQIYRFSPTPAPGEWVALGTSGGTITSGTFAARPAASTKAANAVYWATDRTVAWINISSTWTYLFGTHRDTLANKPTPTANDVGYLFYATDYHHTWRWSGSAWSWAPGDDGAGYLLWHTGTPSMPGASSYGVCNGSTYAVCNADATTTNVTTPNLNYSSNGVTGGFFKAMTSGYAGGAPAGGGGAETGTPYSGSTNVAAGGTAVSTTAHKHAIGIDAGLVPAEPVYWDVHVYLRR